MEEKYQTLGGNAIPGNYSLVFYTDLAKTTFACEEVIDLVMKKKSKNLVLNSRELKIGTVYAEDLNGSQTAKVRIKKKDETVIFVFKRPLSGNLKLHIKFNGTNNDKMYGFYRSTYKHDGKEEVLLTTQFEPADARSAFVCFDEPSLKATFDIALVVDEVYEALSNMPVKEVKAVGTGRKMVRFFTTPKMSAYLLYLGVGKFDRVSTNLGKLKISALTTPGKKNLAQLCLGYAKQFVDYYQRYFGIDFPLPKIDIIGVPDFSAGAMENWGAITFREADMLGSNKSSAANKQRIAVVVSHELAHQWFGDLVTMVWWNDIWLNESFAEFMSYKARDSVFPEWKVMDQFYVEDFSEALSADSVRSTHPISLQVRTPGEISSMFDEISYQKGAVVLSMIEQYVGKEIFRKGLQSYLKGHMFSNAQGKDLWDAIGTASKKAGKIADASEFAGAWITKKGHPIINVTKKGSTIKLSQKRFTTLKQFGGNENLWPIPVEYIELPSGKTGRFKMKTATSTIKAGKDQSVKLNYRSKYFYRSAYPLNLLERLGAYVKDGRLGSIDAFDLERGIFTAARNGSVRLDKYIKFISLYCMDVDYPADYAILENLEALLYLSEKNRYYQALGKLCERFCLGVIEKTGWEPRIKDTNITKNTRTKTLTMLGKLGNAKALRLAERTYSLLVSGKPNDMDMVKFAVSVLAKTANAKLHREFINMYEKAATPELKRYFLLSLGSFEGPELTRASLSYALSEKVRKQDTYQIPAKIAERMDGYPVVWEWTKKNWKTLEGYFPTGTHMIQNFISNASYMHTEKERADFLRFAKRVQKGKDDIKKEVRETLDIIDTNIRFFKTNGDAHGK